MEHVTYIEEGYPSSINILKTQRRYQIMDMNTKMKIEALLFRARRSQEEFHKAAEVYLKNNSDKVELSELIKQVDIHSAIMVEALSAVGKTIQKDDESI